MLGIVWPYYMGKHVNYREAIKSNVDPLKITFYLATLDGFVSRRDRPTDVSLLSLGSNSTTTTTTSTSTSSTRRSRAAGLQRMSMSRLCGIIYKMDIFTTYALMC